ncbi:hypothetical protein EWM60_16930 [Candidatus Erwinia dacicola]|nr:hypothetical protein [Candidatus Erwinia dacicola]
MLPWSAQAVNNPLAQRAQAQGTTEGVWLDLPLLAQRIARRAGVPQTQIEQAGICTYCMAEEKASYRRNSHCQHGYEQRFSWITKR